MIFLLPTVLFVCLDCCDVGSRFFFHLMEVNGTHPPGAQSAKSAIEKLSNYNLVK